MLVSTYDLYFASLERFESHCQFFPLKSRFFNACERVSDTFNKIFTTQLFNLILKKNYAHFNYLDAFLEYKNCLNAPQDITQVVAQYTKLV